ncbi:MAG TPA: peptidoglycan DD-metalloendopeptidase family protein [Bacteroidia bacterium]|jgi:septal ring factor EnvC (AmiA/AmiB activator)|nr:peptidoglycan DD-metalloendopeptidase family protein [Bacteroidia bacterium]
MTANRSFSSKRLRRAISLPAAIFIVTAFVVAGSSFVFAKTKQKTKTAATKPDKAALKKKKAKLQADIDLTDSLLKQTRRNKTLSLGQLVAINNKIEARNAMITEITNEVSDLQDQIDENNANVARLDTAIAQAKRDYARMIVFAYKNRNPEQRMMFIFSSADFNQAYLRMRYMQQVGEDRRKYAEDIAAQELVLNENLRTLEAQKADKEELLGTQQTEFQQLADEKNDKDKTLLQLKDKEATLKDELAKKKKEKADIDAAIQKLIADEAARIAAANTTTSTSVPKPKSGTTTTTTTTSTTVNTSVLTPDAQLLSDNFAGNQGALPWPVLQGSITGHFGKQEHPVLKGVYVNNNGIDIATTAGSSARAIFDGEVTGVTNIEGSGWLVIVRHGEYLTVYAQLESVTVKQGDKVKAKQSIGKVGTDADDGQTVLHFEVWKTGIGKMDPEKWLASAH